MFNLAWTLATEEQFLFVLAACAAAVAKLVVIRPDRGHNRSENSYGPRPHFMDPAAGRAAHSNRARHRYSDLPGSAAGTGSTLETWFQHPLQHAGMEVVRSRPTHGALGVSGARTAAPVAVLSHHHGAGRSMRGSRRPRTGGSAATPAIGVRWHAELRLIFVCALATGLAFLSYRYDNRRFWHGKPNFRVCVLSRRKASAGNHGSRRARFDTIVVRGFYVPSQILNFPGLLPPRSLLTYCEIKFAARSSSSLPECHS